MSTLQVTNLGKRYGSSAVFSNVSFSVPPGEFIAIVGDSGVGKSTLLNCLAGLDDWDSGRITHGDTDLGTLDETQRALWRRAQVGFVFQAFHVLPHLDVAQNVALPLLLLGRPDTARVQQMLDAVGLDDLGARLPQQLSGGQLQRGGLARGLVPRPPLGGPPAPAARRRPAAGRGLGAGAGAPPRSVAGRRANGQPRPQHSGTHNGLAAGANPSTRRCAGAGDALRQRSCPRRPGAALER